MAKKSGPVAPAKFYARGDALYIQAQQIWCILTGFVMMHRYPVADPSIRRDFVELITYEELAELMGRPDAYGVLGRQLGIVGDYCLMNDLPALNAIVVNKKYHKPGKRVVHHEDRSVYEEQRAIDEIDWFSVRPPTVGALRKVYDAQLEEQRALRERAVRA